MNHHASLPDLALFSAGDLDDAQQAAVAVHVSGCPECRARVSEFRSIETALSQWTVEPSAEDLQCVRETTVRHIATRPTAAAHWFPWAIGAAAILLLLVVTLKQSVRPAPQLNTGVIELPRLQLPEMQLVPRREQRPKPAGSQAAGMRNVSLENGVLKMTTADPNVVIFLLLEGETLEN